MHTSKAEQVLEDHDTSRKHRWRDKLTSKVHNLTKPVNDDDEDDGLSKFFYSASPPQNPHVDSSRRPVTTPALAASVLPSIATEENQAGQVHLHVSPERWKPLPRNKGYRVRFDPQPPATIGVGGDEAEMPTVMISNARRRRDTDRLVASTHEFKEVVVPQVSQQGRQQEGWSPRFFLEPAEIESAQRLRLPRRPTGLINPAPASSADVDHLSDGAVITSGTVTVPTTEHNGNLRPSLHDKTPRSQIPKAQLSEGLLGHGSVFAIEKPINSALECDHTNSPLAPTEFERLIRHLFTEFEHDSFNTQLNPKPSFAHCVRAASWWFLKGRGELESTLRGTTANVGTPVEIDSSSLNQAYMDLAKAWWIVRQVIPSHPESRKLGGAETISTNGDLGNIRATSLANLAQMYLETISGMRMLAKSMEKNHRLPPDMFQTRYLNSEIWFYSPVMASRLKILSKSVVSGSIPQIGHDTTSYLPILVGDTKRRFNFGRMFVDISLVSEGKDEDDIQVPCILSILRERTNWHVEVAITSQDEEINLLIQSDDQVGMTWDEVQWNRRKHIIRVSLPSKMHLHVELTPQDYNTLRNIYEYTQKVSTELTGSADEEMVFDLRIVDFREIEVGVPSKASFPRSSTGYILRLFEKICVFAEGTDQREIFHGHRLMVVTPPEHKALTTFNRVIGQQAPILFSYLKGEGDAPAMLIETFHQGLHSSSVIRFSDTSHRESFLSVLNGTSLQKGENASPALLMKSLTLYSTTEPIQFSFGEGLQWQQLRVIDISLEKSIDKERSTTLSENLRICANCSVGTITDRINLGPGELLFSLSIEEVPAIKLYRCPQPDMTFCFVKNLMMKEDRATLANVSQTVPKSSTIREYSFHNLRDLHVFQEYITGFRVLYDGIATDFMTGRRRMKVPALRRVEAEQARLQIVKQKHVVQLLVISKLAGLVANMSFVLRATDIFESSEHSGNFYLRINEARFATPKGNTEQGTDFVCLDNPEFSGKREDVTIGFDTEAKRDRFGEMLPEAVSKAATSRLEILRKGLI